jgi:hypothetical protein
MIIFFFTTFNQNANYGMAEMLFFLSPASLRLIFLWVLRAGDKDPSLF